MSWSRKRYLILPFDGIVPTIIDDPFSKAVNETHLRFFIQSGTGSLTEVMRRCFFRACALGLLVTLNFL